jgi:hypothetical protein
MYVIRCLSICLKCTDTSELADKNNKPLWNVGYTSARLHGVTSQTTPISYSQCVTGITYILRICNQVRPKKETMVLLTRNSEGAFATLRKATLSFIPVRPSAYPSSGNNSASAGRILMKFYIWAFFENLSRKFKVSLKSDKNNGCFTWRRFHIYGDISLNSSYNEKCLIPKL